MAMLVTISIGHCRQISSSQALPIWATIWGGAGNLGGAGNSCVRAEILNALLMCKLSGGATDLGTGGLFEGVGFRIVQHPVGVGPRLPTAKC